MMDLATAPACIAESPTVKSAHRVLEVLEYFAQGSGKATVMQIANDLAYPQSSTSVLLASLAKLGYLRFESEGVHVRFILNLPGKDPQSLRFPLGVLRPVCRSAAGRILLARLPDEEILRIARSANAQIQAPSDFIPPSELMTEIEGIRERGWNLATDYPLPNRATLALPLPALLGQPPMSLIVGTRKATMLEKFDDILEEMRQSCARLISGPVQQVELPDS
jgi:DNA-binding IclR family transcriptional regulator